MSAFCPVSANNLLVCRWTKRNNSIDGNVTKMPATNNSNNEKLFTQDFSFIFHFVQITYRQLPIRILLFYFVICECGRLTHTYIHHTCSSFPYLHVKLYDKVAKEPQFDKIFYYGNMWVAGTFNVHIIQSQKQPLSFTCRNQAPCISTKFYLSRYNHKIMPFKMQDYFDVGSSISSYLSLANKMKKEKKTFYS